MSLSALPDMVQYPDLAAFGLTRHRFDQMVEAEEYERVAPGLFLRGGTVDDTTAGWIAAAVKAPDATLCLLSALAVHDLTDEVPSRTNIALPRGVRHPTVGIAPIAWHQFDASTFAIGRDTRALPTGVVIGLYSPERTIVDLFRLRHDWGSDLAVGALKRWLSGSGNSPATLLQLSKAFPKALPALRGALEVLL